MTTWTPTDAEYFAATEWLSHSEFKLFAKSPALYERHVIRGVPVKTNDSMDFGSEVDAAVFHPSGFAANVAVPSRDDLSPTGRKTGEKFKAFCEANAGKQIVKADEPLARVLDSLHSHPEAIGVLEAMGESQVAFRWESEVGGVKLNRRAKLDKLPTGLPFIADLKTTKDPSPDSFAKDIVNLKYHTQAVWYQDAVESQYGQRPPFLIVAVQNCEPYDCEVYELDDDFIQLGRRTIDAKLAEFVACRAANRWRRESHGKIVKLSPPRWASYQLDDWKFQEASA